MTYGAGTESKSSLGLLTSAMANIFKAKNGHAEEMKKVREQLAMVDKCLTNEVQAAQAVALKRRAEVQAHQAEVQAHESKYASLFHEHTELKRKMEARPAPIQRLDETLNTTSNPEDWLKNTNVFVGDVFCELLVKHEAAGTAAVSQMQAAFPLHFQMYETIKVTKEEMLTSVATSTNQQWPAKATAESLGLLSVLTFAKKAVEDSICTQFIATLNQIPVENTMPFKDIETVLVQRIESAAALAPKLKEALKTIESIVNASIKAKVGSHATYKRHCQGRLGTRGIGINPPKQLPYSAEMTKYDLNDLEDRLLQNAESKMMTEYECAQRAFPPAGFRT